MKATRQNARISPKKANLVANLVRGMYAEEAITTLRFTNKKAAGMIKKLIESAVANAENNFKQKRENLVIEEIKVSKGMSFRRYIPVSRGRAQPIDKFSSHIHVILKSAPKKEEKKEEAKTTTNSKK